MSKKIVHMIANAHIDPIWLWNKQSGIDEILNTCETMVYLLEKHDNFRFTAAESFRYAIIEKLNEKLLGRIKEHVKDGRWEIAGGWWLQPDCNQPTYEGFYHQIAVGYDYMMKTFGFFPEMGYNVDSFGHSAILPQLLNEFKQKYYVFMRPSRGEFPYPHNIFKWQGTMGGEVTALRITGGGYGANNKEAILNHIPEMVNDVPAEAHHLACFYGVGDHGGGPTSEMINYFADHKNDFDGLEIRLSTLTDFFKGIENDNLDLATHKGDLQLHAVGCYSVKRDIKTQVRKAEQRLAQVAEINEHFHDEREELLKTGWQETAFAAFHDILGGTSIQSATTSMINRLGGVITEADDLLNDNIRRKVAGYPEHPYQRMIIDNKSAVDVADYVEIEPWLQWFDLTYEDQWKAGEKLVDLGTGNEVDYQVVQTEQLYPERMMRLLFKQSLKCNETAVLSMESSPKTEMINEFKNSDTTITHSNGNSIDLKANKMKLGAAQLPVPQHDYIVDMTDNWSHGVTRFPEADRKIKADFNEYFLLEDGPVRSSILRRGQIGKSKIHETWRIYEDGRYIELKLKINWQEEHKMLKYTIPFNMEKTRLDGIAGGFMIRENDGIERPFHYFTVINETFAIVSPDIYGFDVNSDEIRLSLLRNPVQTHHDPNGFDYRYAVFSDTGEHEFTIRFTNITDWEILRNMAETMQRPLIFAETTRGMTKR